MGLKGYRLWVMGKLESTCRAPPLDRVGTLYTTLFCIQKTVRFDDSQYVM
jgi:hypothetical protein